MRKYSLFFVGIFAVTLIGFGCTAKSPATNEPAAKDTTVTETPVTQAPAPETTAREPNAAETLAKSTATTTTPTTTTETPKTPAPTAKGPTGPELFKSSNCTMCHKAPSVDGGGSMGPDLKGVGAKLSAAKLNDQFKGSHNGRFKGNAEELKTLIAWLSSLK